MSQHDSSAHPPSSSTGRGASVGLCLSGGGYRATAWGLGSAVGLARASEVDVELSVVSVASVSGGSLANAALADVGARDFDELSAEDLLREVAPMLHHVAHGGLIRYAAATNVPVVLALVVGVLSCLLSAALVGALVGWGRAWGMDHVMIIGAALGTASGGLALWKSRVLPPVERIAVAMLGLLAPVGVALGAAVGGAWTADASGVAPAAGMLLLVVSMWCIFVRLVGRRGRLVERAMAAGPLGRRAEGGTGARRLDEVHGRRVHHVFCAAELQSGDNFYLSPRMAYGHRFGWSSSPGSWTVARAVQASAALPLGFPPQYTTFEDVGLDADAWLWRPSTSSPAPAGVVLVDGGVYDNMATEWEVGLPARRARLGGEADGPLDRIQPPAGLLVVANAGKSLAWSEMKARGLRGELAGLMRDQSIQYDQTTASRRRSLVAMFRAAEAGATGLPMGVIVQASTSPLRVAESIAAEGSGAPSAKQARAAAWASALRRCDVDWDSLAARSAGVPTVLSALGVDQTTDLVWHAAVLTQAQLHIHYGIGDAEPIDRSLIESTVRRDNRAAGRGATPWNLSAT